MSMASMSSAKSFGSKWKGKSSSKNAAKKRAPEPLCPGRLGKPPTINMQCLVPHYTSNSDYNCDYSCPECDNIRTFPKMTLMWGCRTCNWDVCRDCFQRKHPDEARVEADLVFNLRRQRAPRLPTNKEIRNHVLNHRHELKQLAKETRNLSVRHRESLQGSAKNNRLPETQNQVQPPQSSHDSNNNREGSRNLFKSAAKGVMFRNSAVNGLQQQPPQQEQANDLHQVDPQLQIQQEQQRQQQMMLEQEQKQLEVRQQQLEEQRKRMELQQQEQIRRQQQFEEQQILLKQQQQQQQLQEQQQLSSGPSFQIVARNIATESAVVSSSSSQPGPAQPSHVNAEPSPRSVSFQGAARGVMMQQRTIAQIQTPRQVTDNGLNAPPGASHSLVPRPDLFRDRVGGYEWRKQQTIAKRSRRGGRPNYGSSRKRNATKTLISVNSYDDITVGTSLSPQSGPLSPVVEDEVLPPVPVGQAHNDNADVNLLAAATAVMEGDSKSVNRYVNMPGSEPAATDDELLSAAAAALEEDESETATSGLGDDELVKAAMLASVDSDLPVRNLSIRCSQCSNQFANYLQDGDFDSDSPPGQEAWFCNACWDKHDEGDTEEVVEYIPPSKSEEPSETIYKQHQLASISEQKDEHEQDDDDLLSDFEEEEIPRPTAVALDYGQVSLVNGVPQLETEAVSAEGDSDEEEYDTVPDGSIGKAESHGYGITVIANGARTDPATIAAADAQLDEQIERGIKAHEFELQKNANDHDPAAIVAADAELDAQIEAKITTQEAEMNDIESDSLAEVLDDIEDRKIEERIRQQEKELARVRAASLDEAQKLQHLEQIADQPARSAYVNVVVPVDDPRVAAADSKLDDMIESMIADQEAEIADVRDELNDVAEDVPLVRSEGSLNHAGEVATKLAALKRQSSQYENVGVSFKGNRSKVETEHTTIESQEDSLPAGDNTYVNVVPGGAIKDSSGESVQPSPYVDIGVLTGPASSSTTIKETTSQRYVNIPASGTQNDPSQTYINASSSQQQSGPLDFFRAKAPYFPKDSRQLEVAKGDVFKILENKASWSRAVKIDPTNFKNILNEGWVSHRILDAFSPSDEQREQYAEGVATRVEAKSPPTSPKASSVTPKVGSYYQAMSNFEAKMPKQLSYSKHAVFKLLSQPKLPGWWEVERVDVSNDLALTGERGFVVTRVLQEYVSNE